MCRAPGPVAGRAGRAQRNRSATRARAAPCAWPQARTPGARAAAAPARWPPSALPRYSAPAPCQTHHQGRQRPSQHAGTCVQARTRVSAKPCAGHARYGASSRHSRSQHAPAQLAGHRAAALQRRAVAAVVRQRYVPHDRLHLGPRDCASGCTGRERASSRVRRTPRAQQTTLATPSSVLRHAAALGLGSRRCIELAGRMA